MPNVRRTRDDGDPSRSISDGSKALFHPVKTTTYHAVATRSGDWWAIEIISGLPDTMLGVSQAHSLEEVEDVARGVVADLLEIEPNEIVLRVSVAHPGKPEGSVAVPGSAVS